MATRPAEAALTPALIPTFITLNDTNITRCSMAIASSTAEGA